MDDVRRVIRHLVLSVLLLATTVAVAACGDGGGTGRALPGSAASPTWTWDDVAAGVERLVADHPLSEEDTIPDEDAEDGVARGEQRLDTCYLGDPAMPMTEHAGLRAAGFMEVGGGYSFIACMSDEDDTSFQEYFGVDVQESPSSPDAFFEEGLSEPTSLRDGQLQVPADGSCAAVFTAPGSRVFVTYRATWEEEALFDPEVQIPEDCSAPLTESLDDVAAELAAHAHE